MADEKEKAAPASPLSPDEMKVLARALWGCLLAPSWKKDDLITLGKLLFAKKELKEIDEKVFIKEVWPNLKVMTESLSATLTKEAEKQAEKASSEEHAAGRKEPEAKAEKKEAAEEVVDT